MVKFGKVQKFSICLSKNSNGEGLRKLAEKEASVTFLNRTECCEQFNIADDDDNIRIIEEVIAKVPAHSVVLFDEVPLFSNIGKDASYDWSLLENKRPEEVTAVVCLQPIRIAATFRHKTHTVVGPKDADMVHLTNQYRNTTNILGLVNQLCQDLLPIEYADVKVFPSHDVQGPEVTAISISSQSQAAELRKWLCNQLQQKLNCKPSQVKMIYVSSTEELAKAVVQGTVYENSAIQIDKFQGCETYVGVVFLGMDLGNDNNFSQLLEMCSRAQYKLILVISRDNSLLHEIKRAQTEISILNVEDVTKCPVETPMKQLPGTAPYSQGSEAPASSPEQLVPPDFGDNVSENPFAANYGKEDVEILLPDLVGDTLELQHLLKKEDGSGSVKPLEDPTFSNGPQFRPISSIS